MESVLQFLKEHENLIESDEFDDFFEDIAFNDLDDDTKREVFYLKVFYMSTQKYSTLEECIEDFKKITSEIKDNDFLKNTHECYETMICNYLNIIDDFIKPSINDNEEDFINCFHEFVDLLKDDNICYPNDTIKKNIIKELISLQGNIMRFNNKITDEYITKFNRYCDDLEKYISEKKNELNDINIKSNSNEINSKEEINNQENKNENNIIEDENDIKQKNNLKDSINIESLSNDNDSLINNIDEFIKNKKINEESNSDKIEYSDNIINNNNIINISNNNNKNINISNNFNLNNINNINFSNNNIKESENQEFKISYNKSLMPEKNNSLNNFQNYKDSIIEEFSLSNIINEIVNSENKELEEEKVQEIYDEVDNFTNIIASMFDSNNNINNDKIINNAKKEYLKNENNICANNGNIITNFQKIDNDSNNNISINSANKPKKKKKGKKKNFNSYNKSDFN